MKFYLPAIPEADRTEEKLQDPFYQRRPEECKKEIENTSPEKAYERPIDADALQFLMYFRFYEFIEFSITESAEHFQDDRRKETMFIGNEFR